MVKNYGKELWGCMDKHADFIELYDLRKIFKNLKVYTFVDSRDVDRYENFKLFLRREDAEKLRESMGNDMNYYDVHEVEVIK